MASYTRVSILLFAMGRKIRESVGGDLLLIHYMTTGRLHQDFENQYRGRDYALAAKDAEARLVLPRYVRYGRRC